MTPILGTFFCNNLVYFLYLPCNKILVSFVPMIVPLLKVISFFIMLLVFSSRFCLQACPKILMKFITHFFHSCYSPSCNKLYFSTFFNNCLNYLIYFKPHICCSFQKKFFSFILFSFSNLFYNCFVYGFFLHMIPKYWSDVTTCDGK